MDRYATCQGSSENIIPAGHSLAWMPNEPFPDRNVDEVYKDEAMKRNTWKVCEEVVLRLDVTPGSGGNDFLQIYRIPSKEENKI